jgi:glycerol-3-phosphate dehydrogenase (NAD(P)+)
LAFYNQLTVLGGGSWATALVKIIAENQDVQINWWLRNEADAQHIRTYGHNPKYLSAVQIRNEKVHAMSDIKQACSGSELIILAIPSAFLHRVLQGFELPAEPYYVSAIKGIVPETRQVIARYLETEHHLSPRQLAVVTGPCHAEEVALEKLSYLTVASLPEEPAASIADLLACRYIRTTVSQDLYGAEYAAVLKNIYAIAAGIAHGLGYGDNYVSVMICHAIREMERFLDALHETHRDVKDNAYLGDLLVTAYSQFSRNRTFGNMLGKGYSVTHAQLEMNMIAEGYYATDSVYLMNRELGVHMPLLDAVYAVVYGKRPAQEVWQRVSLELG